MITHLQIYKSIRIYTKLKLPSNPSVMHLFLSPFLSHMHHACTYLSNWILTLLERLLFYSFLSSILLLFRLVALDLTVASAGAVAVRTSSLLPKVPLVVRATLHAAPRTDEVQTKSITPGRRLTTMQAKSFSTPCALTTA